MGIYMVKTARHVHTRTKNSSSHTGSVPSWTKGSKTERLCRHETQVWAWTLGCWCTNACIWRYFSGRDYNEIIAALDSLAGRFFTYEDDEEWWKCGFISNPKYKKRTGIITFRVSNDLWDVFTKFAKGYREFELNKALALPTGYSLRFYMLMSGQVYPWIYPLKTWKTVLAYLRTNTRTRTEKTE